MKDGNGEELDDQRRIVKYGGYERTMIDGQLLEQQDAWDQLPNIKLLHWARFLLADIMENTDDITKLRRADAIWDRLEARLQVLWDFPVDPKYVEFWYRPKCRCPRMDNDDAYPTGYYAKRGDCPLHGTGTTKEIQ